MNKEEIEYFIGHYSREAILYRNLTTGNIEQNLEAAHRR